jgi:hypothetical protein
MEELRTKGLKKWRSSRGYRYKAVVWVTSPRFTPKTDIQVLHCDSTGLLGIVTVWCFCKQNKDQWQILTIVNQSLNLHYKVLLQLLFSLINSPPAQVPLADVPEAPWSAGHHLERAWKSRCSARECVGGGQALLLEPVVDQGVIGLLGASKLSCLVCLCTLTQGSLSCLLYYGR